MCFLRMLRHLLVGSFHLTADDAVAESVVVLVVFIAAHDEHLHERHLLAKAVIEILQGLSDGTRGHDGLRRASSVRAAASEIFKMNRCATGAQILVSTASASAAAARRRALSSSHLVFAQVCLHILGHHLVEDRAADVLERLSERSAHLVFHLALQEVVKVLALS